MAIGFEYLASLYYLVYFFLLNLHFLAFAVLLLAGTFYHPAIGHVTKLGFYHPAIGHVTKLDVA